MTRRATPKTIVVFVTAGTKVEARKIARVLVGERLAACVNIVGPIRSIYCWREAIEDAAEYLLIIKTRRRLFSAVSRRVRELHSYEVVEVIALPIQQAGTSYLAWLLRSTISRRRSGAGGRAVTDL